MKDHSDDMDEVKRISHHITQNSHQNNNINGFELPIKLKREDNYQKELEKILCKYSESIKSPSFSFDSEIPIVVKDVSAKLLKCYDMLCRGDQKAAERNLADIIIKFLDNSFLISPLNKSYAFRAMAPFINNYRDDSNEFYKEMCTEEITFFRARSTKEELTELKDIVHPPYRLRDKIESNRFNTAGQPAFYLGTTSYVSCKEIKMGESKSKKSVFLSAFKPNEAGKALSILNLTGSQSVINGAYNIGTDPECFGELQSALIKIFPLVIAISFKKENEGNDFKDNYLISQLLMNVIHKFNIDGIAYLSMQGKDEFQYPQGVNLVLSAFDVNERKEFGDCCYDFYMTKPFKFIPTASHPDLIYSKESYINKIYKESKVEKIYAHVDFGDVDRNYEDSNFGKFDNFLVSQNFMDFKA